MKNSDKAKIKPSFRNYYNYEQNYNFDNNQDNSEELKNKINGLEQEIKKRANEIKELNFINSKNETELKSLRKDKINIKMI